MRRAVKGKAVRRELRAGSSDALLKELHLLTRGGDLNADSLRKLKQVNHLLNLLEPAARDVLDRFGDPVVIDCGAGKSYLGFLFYEAFLAERETGRVISVESRGELVKAGAERAARTGFARMTFVNAKIDDTAAIAALPARAHLVTALHACDTATDEALALAIRLNADHVALVPCCQAELARQLEAKAPPDPALAALCERPWHRRELGSHLANVIRALTLEAHGYRVTVTELAGWEHSLKNELILAKKTRASDPEAKAKLDELLAATGVTPRLIAMLKEAGASPA